MPDKNSLYIIDGHAMIYRAYYAFIKRPLLNSQGQNTSAVFGFLRILFKLMKTFQPEHLLIAFDSKGKTFRHKKFPAYKEQRKAMPEDMPAQIDVIRQFVEALHIPSLEAPGYEADDIIGTVSKKLSKEGHEVVIVSRDKDLSQLINDHVKLLLPAMGVARGKEDDFLLIDKKNAQEKFMVPPEKMTDLLGLMGDASDNIPGVRGIGPKTAVRLLKEFGSLNSLLNNLDKVKQESARKKLEAGRESAELSRELATIKCDMDLSFSWDDLVPGEPDKPAIEELLEKHSIRSLAKEIDLLKAPVRNAYQTISTPEELKTFIKDRLSKTKICAFDTETDSLDFLSANIIGVSFSFQEKEAVYIAFHRNSISDTSRLDPEEGLKLLKPWLENESLKKIGQNIKFDALVLNSHGITLNGIIFDTMLASFLIDPSEPHNMDDMAEQHLGVSTISFDDLTGKGRNRISILDVPLDRLSEYAAEDADITFQLYHVLEKKIREMKLEALLKDLDLPLMHVLMSMEKNGVQIDRTYLEKLTREFRKDLAGLQKKIWIEAGEEFNINSTKQLSTILFEKMKISPLKKTKTSFSTDTSVLEQLSEEYEIARLLLDYRTLAKLMSTYTEALPELIHPSTQRVHTSFNQTIAATGRLSSTKPNLQNIPIRGESGRRIRYAFTAPPGHMILSSDYSQIELRILAHISNDTNMIRAFQEDSDIHKSTASQIYGISIDDVSQEERNAAKTINFGIVYGMGPFNLAKQLGIPQTAAKLYIDNYFRQYPGIREYFDQIRNLLIKQNYVENLFGRRRSFPPYNDLPHRQQESVFRMALNTPIQSTAADLIKKAMISLHEEMKKRKLKSRLIMQIHDELVLEIPENEKQVMTALVKEKMEKAYTFSVPLKVEIGCGPNWAEAH